MTVLVTVCCAVPEFPNLCLFAVQCSVQCSAVCSAVQCSAVQCSAVQCSAVCSAVHVYKGLFSQWGSPLHCEGPTLHNPHNLFHQVHHPALTQTNVAHHVLVFIVLSSCMSKEGGRRGLTPASEIPFLLYTRWERDPQCLHDGNSCVPLPPCAWVTRRRRQGIALGLHFHTVSKQKWGMYH